MSHQNDATILELMYYIIYKQLSAHEKWTQLSSVPWNVWLPDRMTVYILLNMFLNEKSKELFKTMNITELLSESLEFFKSWGVITKYHFSY